MQTLPRNINPFALMLDPQAVLAQIERSERLESLHRRVCRPLDKPLLGGAADDAGDVSDLSVAAAGDGFDMPAAVDGQGFELSASAGSGEECGPAVDATQPDPRTDPFTALRPGGSSGGLARHD